MPQVHELLRTDSIVHYAELIPAGFSLLVNFFSHVSQFQNGSINHKVMMLNISVLIVTMKAELQSAPKT